MYRLRSPTPDVDDELIRGIVIECLDAWLPGCHRHSGGVDDPPVVSLYPDSDFRLGIVMSVHVVSSLHLDYVRAGVVTTVVTIATMISGPWRGSMVDRHGLRRTMFPSLIITTITWGSVLG